MKYNLGLPLSPLTSRSFSSNRLLQAATESSETLEKQNSNHTTMQNTENENNSNYNKKKNEDEVVQTYLVVNEYIDKLLQEAIDNVLVQE